MKRMKKKVVAMVTLAMFVMTLLPMAAFAAEATPENSYVSFDYDNPTVDTNEVVVVKAHTYADAEQKVPAQLNNVRIWLTDDNKNDAIVKDAKFGSLNADKDGLQSVWTTTHDSQANGIPDGIVKGHLVNDQEFGVVIPNEGVYTLHVGQVQEDAAGNAYVAEVDYDNGATITVNAQVEDQMTFVTEGSDKLTPVDDVVTVTKDMLTKAKFEYNGVDTYIVTGTLLDDQGKIMKHKDVTLSSNKDALVLEDETVTTERDGSFEIEFSLNDEVNAAITVAYGDLTYTVRVDAADTDLDTIETVKEDGYVLAGTDTKNWPNASKKFTDAVQFDITDQNGNVVLNGLTATEPATNQNDADHSKYVKVTKPGNSTLDAEDLKLVWDSEEEVYTVEYVGNAPKKDLVEGEYTVKVALLSGSSATATFNAAKFGDVEEVEVETYAKAKNSDNKTYVKVEDEIALGDDLGLKAKYVDENGLKINAPKDKVVLGADGKAIAAEYAHKFSNDYYEYALQTNTVANEALIGTVIKVKAFDNNEKKLVEKELTVVDAYDSYGLAFDSNEGEVNIDNNVEVSVVDADDNVAKKVSGDVYAYVAKQSNEDAKVTVTADKKAAKGEFNIKVYSNKATTADIVVGVKATNGAIYAGTLSYTFGEEDIPAGTSVVMTLGSTEMIINNEVVDMKDAAPFAQNNRTYVPFRALGEALGAQVEYDKDAKTVTYELGSTKIVMTLDSKTYTVNGAEKTMDVAPFAKDNRTYVPVRFVGEGLGFTVTGLTNANGQYVAVAFTK